MKKIIILIANLTVSFGANAIDVYGVNPIDAENILKKYGAEVNKIELVLQKEVLTMKPNENFSKETEKLIARRLAIMNEMKREKGYLLVDFQTVYYPFEKAYYSTIEVVDKKNPERMRFVSVMPMTHVQEKVMFHKPDLISEMEKYMYLSMHMLMNNELGSTALLCPVYHCTVGFEHSKLKPYLTVFNKGVIQQKKLIVDTLNHDKDPNRRTAAAFLIGHFQDPHEIISLLSPHVDDKDDGVRNGVMRVIGATMSKAKITNIDIIPFIGALDSPYITDRNKALLVLTKMAVSASAKQLILEKAGEKLLSILRLQQPNNHDSAYLLLKTISAKDFGPTNVSAWSKWVSSAVTVVPHAHG